jgi:hypothetical protein
VLNIVAYNYLAACPGEERGKSSLQLAAALFFILIDRFMFLRISLYGSNRYSLILSGFYFPFSNTLALLHPLAKDTRMVSPTLI